MTHLMDLAGTKRFSRWRITITLWLLMCSVLWAQPTDHFLATWEQWQSSTTPGEPAHADSIFAVLMKLHESHPGRYDTLITAIVNFHFEQTAAPLLPDEQLAQLRSYDKNLAALQAVDHLAMANFYSHYVRLFNAQYQLDSVSVYLDHMGQHLDQLSTPVEMKILWWYEKGRLVSRQGDFKAGLYYAQRGLDYLNLHFPDKYAAKYRLLNAIGIAYRRMDKIDEAILHYETLLRDEWEPLHSARLGGAMLNNLGLAYKDCGDWEAAIRTIDKAITYYQENYSPTYPDIGSGYDNIAICYEALGNPAQALAYSRRSMQFIAAHLGSTHPDMLLPMNSITFTLMQQEKLDQAKEMNDQALALLRTTGWSAQSPAGNFYLADGFDVLAFRVGIYGSTYELNADTAYLHESLRAGDAFMQLTDYAYDHLQNDISKSLFQQAYEPLFSAYIHDLHTQFGLTHDRVWMERAFACAEKFKSLELLYAAQKDKADQVSRYKALNDEHQSLLDSIQYYENKQSASDQKKEEPNQASQRLHEWQTALHQWKERTRAAHPDYYSLIYHPEPISIADLQGALQPDQCIISYHLAAESLFAFVITASQQHFIKIAIPENLPALIASFRSLISKHGRHPQITDDRYMQDAHAFTETAHTLYTCLLGPLDSLLKPRLILIVEKSLSYIPFDLLLKKLPTASHRFNHHAYVLHDHAVSYSYSCRLWWDMRSRSSMPGMRVLSFAPEFRNADKDIALSRTSAFQDLDFNQAEAGFIHTLMAGKLLTKQKATKSNFIRLAAEYPIIHLATHSQANDDIGDQSFLAFSADQDENSLLQASEIYDLDLHAELVTLSACETGLGELRYGEGLISLARAFSFAGARSILSSLWSVNDKSTSTLMASFYKHLLEGMPKDIALQQAKLAYLHSHGHVDAHPFFWAGFIGIGEMAPLRPGASHSMPGFWTLVAGAVLLFTLILIIKKRRTLGTTR